MRVKRRVAVVGRCMAGLEVGGVTLSRVVKCFFLVLFFVLGEHVYSSLIQLKQGLQAQDTRKKSDSQAFCAVISTELRSGCDVALSFRLSLQGALCEKAIGGAGEGQTRFARYRQLRRESYFSGDSPVRACLIAYLCEDSI